MNEPATLIRVYRGYRQDQAAAEFERDALELRRSGYVATSQSWEKTGNLLGLFKQPGSLTVVYERRPVPRAGRRETRRKGVPDAMESLRQLAELRDAGLLTSEEYDRKKRELLDRL